MEANDTMAVNAKTFRKIAKMIRRLVDHIRKEKSLPEKLAREAFDQIDDLAKEALSKPPRNCDFYDNKTDAETRFVEETGENDMAQHYWQMFAIWLLSPAADRKGDNDEK